MEQTRALNALEPFLPFLKFGGEVVLSSNLFQKQQIHAAVRSEDQAQALSQLGVNVLRLDLSDEKAVMESILRHKIDLVIHTASSIDPGLALPLITALGKQREVSGEQTYFIHTSGLSAFYERTGWPSGETRDTDPIFETEKQLADSFPLRNTDVAVTEHAKAVGVTSFIVVPSTVYGKGTGPWNKLSVVYPVYIKAILSARKIYRFPENTKVSNVHVSDLTALYARIIARILRGEDIQSGEKGYYFALAHDTHWWEVLDRVAVAFKARGLIDDDARTETSPSDEVAAEALGVPVQFVQPLWNSGENIVADNEGRIGWKPVWDKEKFLERIDDEIDAVVELGKAKSSLIDSLFRSAK